LKIGLKLSLLSLWIFDVRFKIINYKLTREMNKTLAYVQSKIGKVINDSPSALANWLGGIPIAVSEQELSLQFVVRQEMTNVVGVLHGGVIASMIDDTMGILIVIADGEFFYTTVNLSIDYLSGGKIGDTLITTAKIVRKGRQMINLEAVITTPEGKIIAKATSNCLKTTIAIQV
jgi:uncharacterized protein (TIGR00369 family)